MILLYFLLFRPSPIWCIISRYELLTLFQLRLPKHHFSKGSLMYLNQEPVVGLSWIFHTSWTVNHIYEGPNTLRFDTGPRPCFNASYSGEEPPKPNLNDSHNISNHLCNFTRYVHINTSYLEQEFGFGIGICSTIFLTSQFQHDCICRRSHERGFQTAVCQTPSFLLSLKRTF